MATSELLDLCCGDEEAGVRGSAVGLELVVSESGLGAKRKPRPSARIPAFLYPEAALRHPVGERMVTDVSLITSEGALTSDTLTCRRMGACVV